MAVYAAPRRVDVDAPANTTPKPHSGPVRACPARRRPPFDAAGAAAAAAARLPRLYAVAVRENARAKNVVLRLIPGQGLVITAPVGLPPSRLAEAVGARSDEDRRRLGPAGRRGPPARPGLPPLRPEKLVLTAFDRQWDVAYAARDRAGCLLTVCAGRSRSWCPARWTTWPPWPAC